MIKTEFIQSFPSAYAQILFRRFERNKETIDFIVEDVLEDAGHDDTDIRHFAFMCPFEWGRNPPKDMTRRMAVNVALGLKPDD